MKSGVDGVNLAEIAEGIPLKEFPTPSFVVNLELLEKNLKRLRLIQDRTGAKVLLALKGFAMVPVARLVSQYLSGTTASGLHELILGSEEFGGEAHVYSPAFDERDFGEIVARAHHIVFNSPAQWQRFRGIVRGSNRSIHCGIRVNPEYSEVAVPLYNPCYKHSRLGTTLANFSVDKLDGIDGLHFHSMCQQGAATLKRTIEHVEEKFGGFIRSHCKWVNFGGGHHITRSDYDVDLLCQIIDDFRSKYHVEVYLEPGEAVALNTGILIAQVLDVMHNDMDIAILDTSATTHMPDVLEMPYRPEIVGGDIPGALPQTYRLTGLTCLAGDVIGDYSFPRRLGAGDRLAFTDMGHYSMVKTSTFNGVKLPSICTYDPRTLEAKIHRNFDYDDFRSRLG